MTGTKAQPFVAPEQFVVDVTIRDTLGMVVEAEDEAQALRIIDMVVEERQLGSTTAICDSDRRRFNNQKGYLNAKLDELVEEFIPHFTATVREDRRYSVEEMLATAEVMDRLKAQYKDLLMDGRYPPHYHMESADEIAHAFMRVALFGVEAE